MNNKIPPPIIGLITLLLIWLIARYAPGPQLSDPGLRVFQITLAGLLAGIGLTLDIVSLGLFRRAKTTFNPIQIDKASALVTDGLYRVSRNPMYLGMLLILAGWAIYQGHLFGVVPLALFVWYMTAFQIKPEEAAMIRLFEDDYREYMTRVRRWI